MVHFEELVVIMRGSLFINGQSGIMARCALLGGVYFGLLTLQGSYSGWLTLLWWTFAGLDRSRELEQSEFLADRSAVACRDVLSSNMGIGHRGSFGMIGIAMS